MPVTRTVASVATVSALTACSTLAGFEDFSPRTTSETHICDDLPSVFLHGPRSATQTEMLLVKPVTASTPEQCFWVDKTEVTVEQYQAWVASEPVVEWNPTYCAWKSETGRNDPNGNTAQACRASIDADEKLGAWDVLEPIRCVDFCDALAFCQAHQADLCRVFDSEQGGPDEFRLACSPGLDCNLAQDASCGRFPNVCGPRNPVEYAESCVSVVGAWDTFGNVREWVFSCEPTNRSTPEGQCRVLGGSFQDSELAANCGEGIELPKQTTDAFTGFRCCARRVD